MPVTKYRSVEEMARDRATPTADPGANIAAALELSRVAGWLARARLEPGVHRFRSVEEAWRRRRQPGQPPSQ